MLAAEQRQCGLTKRIKKGGVSVAREELRHVNDLADQLEGVWKALQMRIDKIEGHDAKTRRQARNFMSRELREISAAGNFLFNCRVLIGKHIAIDYEDSRREANQFISKRWVRDIVMERDKWKCVQCPEINNLSIDHIVPVARGGLTVLSNLQTLCRPCNAKKGMQLPDRK